jgi:nicotinamide mononucleotide adenylyltransferase
MVFVVFGRMNPPTRGHEAAILKALEMETTGKPVYVFVTETHAGKDILRNPLLPEDKVEIIRKMLSNKEVVVESTSGILAAIGKLKKEIGEEPITLLLGSDRVKSFQFVKSKFPDVVIEQVGENRNLNTESTDPTNTSKISATRLRNAIASAGNTTTNNFAREIRSKFLSEKLTTPNVKEIIANIKQIQNRYPPKRKRNTPVANTPVKKSRRSGTTPKA